MGRTHKHIHIGLNFLYSTFNYIKFISKLSSVAYLIYKVVGIGSLIHTDTSSKEIKRLRDVVSKIRQQG